MKRRIVCLAVCMLAVLLPLRALAAGETGAGVRTDAGDWKPSRSAMPGEALHFRASLTLRAGESWTVRSVFSPGVEFLSLTAVLADGESVNASYYTLITGARSPANAFPLPLSDRFSARESRLMAPSRRRAADLSGRASRYTTSTGRWERVYLAPFPL